MRNAIHIGNGYIVTTDNSGGIGEKPGDRVAVPDRVTAYFAARVALLEQWASHAEPVTIVIHNFSGSASWDKYVAGVTDLFREAGIVVPAISGSTETNMELVQSAMAVTMIGEKKQRALGEETTWFTYGTPLVGHEVLERKEEVASLRLLKEALASGIVQQIWPVGSSGILQEVRQMTGNEVAQVETVLNSTKSGGPATVVLVAITASKISEAEAFFGASLNKIQIIS
ncbi:alpha-ribazole-5-phosphate synthase [Sporosarcina sp. YIM B06819]|uniref:alpha-ribazole-5-phosphate synthase n=1 Tax=Sporosarcina sp. YIM B06819 TaxID=3081769 RepID=UPI00298D354E|nr:alpha-ribazole-5-phosphate synthase [Sporosarcina sp. YIM B06819]